MSTNPPTTTRHTLLVQGLAAEGGGGGGGSGSNSASADAASESVSAIPQLPASRGDPNIPSIKLGETIRFEEWGPIILNTDGTTRRIENWDQLTEREKQVTWRRISKRNEERRLVLLEQMKQQQEAAAAEAPQEKGDTKQDKDKEL